MKKYSIILLFYTFIFPSFQYIIDQESEEPLSNFKFGEYLIKPTNSKAAPITFVISKKSLWMRANIKQTASGGTVNK